MRFQQELLDSRISEAVAKERELKEQASVLHVKMDNLSGEVARLKAKEERDIEAVKKRANELAEWIKKDS